MKAKIIQTMLWVASVIAIILFIVYGKSEQERLRQLAPKKPVVTNVDEQPKPSPSAPSVTEPQLAVVGAEPVFAEKQYAPPSKDTNEVNKALSDQKSQAEATLRAYQQATGLNNRQMTRPVAPTN